MYKYFVVVLKFYDIPFELGVCGWDSNSDSGSKKNSIPIFEFFKIEIQHTPALNESLESSCSIHYLSFFFGEHCFTH